VLPKHGVDPYLHARLRSAIADLDCACASGDENQIARAGAAEIENWKIVTDMLAGGREREEEPPVADFFQPPALAIPRGSRLSLRLSRGEGGSDVRAAKKALLSNGAVVSPRSRQHEP